MKSNVLFASSGIIFKKAKKKYYNISTYLILFKINLYEYPEIVKWRLIYDDIIKIMKQNMLFI